MRKENSCEMRRCRRHDHRPKAVQWRELSRPPKNLLGSPVDEAVDEHKGMGNLRRAPARAVGECQMKPVGKKNKSLLIAVGGMLAYGTVATVVQAAPRAKKVCFVPTGESLGVGVSYFGEKTERRNEREQVFEDVAGTPLTDNQTRDLVNDSSLGLEMWWLKPMWWNGLRVGGGGEWVSNYSLLSADEDDDAEGDVLGHLFRVFGQAEYSVFDVVSELDVSIGLRAGVSVLTYGRLLRDELDNRPQFDEPFLPSLGAFIAPRIGASWPLSERLRVRGDISADFAKQWLYSLEASDGGVKTSESAALSTTRTFVALGVEFVL